MKDTDNPYRDAVVIGLAIVMPHPTLRGMFVLPGGAICNRPQAEQAAKKLHSLLAKTSN